jgi:hypothetical protein
VTAPGRMPDRSSETHRAARSTWARRLPGSHWRFNAHRGAGSRLAD